MVVVVVGRPLATKLASILMDPGHGTNVAGLGPHTADPQSALCFRIVDKDTGICNPLSRNDGVFISARK